MFSVAFTIEIRRQRKMGHITVVGPAAGVVRSRVETIFGHSEHDPENLRVPAKEIEGLAPTGEKECKKKLCFALCTF